MAGVNINVVVLTGNLTRDPELRTTSGGTSVCSLRIATNGRRKQGDQWVDDPNFFDVTVWGRLGETCAEHLRKGRGVALDGRLDWREWETDGGGKRQAVQVVAHNVQWLGGKDDRGAHGNGRSDVPADTSDFQPQPTGFTPRSGGPADDDIPF